MSATKSEFKQMHPFAKRQAEAKRMRAKYTDRIPVIVEPGSDSKDEDTPRLDKHKFLIPDTLTVGGLMHVIRQRINQGKKKLQPTQALFLFVNGALPPVSTLIKSIDKEHVDQDGFLYVTYSFENTFG